MLKDRAILEEELYFIQEEYYRKRQIDRLQQAAIKNLKKYITISKIIGILNNRIPLQQLTEQELFYIANFMYNETRKENVNIKEWFTESEISNWVNETRKIESDNKIIEIKLMYNGSEINPEYLGYVSYKELIRMMEQGQIEYDTSLQRSPKIITKMGKIIEVPTVNQDSVMEIKDKMLNGEFYSNQITLNMLNEGNVFWNYYNGKLSIDITKGRLLVIDGYHRLSALLKAYRENGDIEGVLNLNIKALDADGCKNFIWQESLANRHDEETVDRFNINSKVTMFINKINSYRNKKYNPLYREIETAIVKGGKIKEDMFRLILTNTKMIDVINDNSINITELTDYVCRFLTCVYDNINDKELFYNYCFLTGTMFMAKDLIGKFDEVKLSEILKNSLINNKDEMDLISKLSPIQRNSISTIKKMFLNIINGVD